MKLKSLLLSASALFIAAAAWAQEPVHGVGGYYNFTPTQMKAANQFTFDKNNGWKVADYQPQVRYTDDMKYMIFNIGVNNTSYNEEQGGYLWRSGINLSESAVGAGAMIMTKDYPVLAFKYSGVSNLSRLMTNWTQHEISIFWQNPETEDGLNPTGSGDGLKKLLLSGLDGNGRYRFYHFQGALQDEFGRDSIYLNNNTALGKSKYRWLNNVKDENGEYIYTPDPSDTTLVDGLRRAEPAWRVMRVDPIDGEKCDVIIGINVRAARKASGLAYIDSCDLKITNVAFSWVNGIADYEGKTIDETPLVYFKWIKTFPSWEAFEASLCDEQNWGDGPEIDPNKAVLNSELYNLKQLIKNYQFSDQIQILQNAYNQAAAVYNAAGSTPDDYSAQLEVIAAAKEQFMAAIAYVPQEPMIKLYSWTGMALGLTSQEVTVGNYTGRALTPVDADNAVPFMLQESGKVGGQSCFNVLNGSNTMVQASDGQLLFVPASQLKAASAKANLVLSNRRSADEPAYDFKVDKYFYYIDIEETGELRFSEELPMVEEIDELSNYLYAPEPAGDYDPADHNDTTHPLKSGEGSLFEFNGAVETVLNPAYEASFAQYDWDPIAKATAQERAMQQQFEGWRTNGWRLGTNIEAVTLDGGEKVMKANYLAEFDDIHVDSINVSTVTTDFGAGQVITLMREHGQYTSAINRIPQPNQLCDSLYAINMNTGINRYFAMKWKGSREEVKFNGLVFFVLKGVEEPTISMDNLLEKRGDVYVWDLLQCGIPYGDRKACAQYLTWLTEGPADIVYVDWMRYYDSLDAIPTETIEVPAYNGIVNVNASEATGLQFYDLNGRLVSTSRPAQKGIYVMKSGKESLKVVVK